jgi:hypothetical protein
VTGHRGLWVCDTLMIQYYLDNRHTNGGKVVSSTHRPHFTPQKHYHFSVSGSHFCYRLSETQGVVQPEGVGKLKKRTPHRIANSRPSGL